MPASKKRKSQRKQTTEQSILRSVSTMELQNEISVREHKISLLVQKRDRLMKKVERLNTQIQQTDEHLASPVKTSKQKPSENTNSLSEILMAALQDKKMNCAEMADAVLETGYATKSKNFPHVVSQCIKKHRSRFRRVSRGVYTVRKHAAKSK